MASVAKETSSIFSSFPPTSVNLLNSATKSLSRIKLGISKSPPAAVSLKFTLYIHPHSYKKSCFQLQSAAESLTIVEEEEVEEREKDTEKSRKPNSRRKLFVLNLPWSFSVADIKTMFSECGAVSDVEVRRGFFFYLSTYFWVNVFCLLLLCGSYILVIFLKIIKQKDGKNRGFAFVTMASGEGAQAAIEKFDSQVRFLCSLKFSNYAISARGILEFYCQYMCSTSGLDCGW